MSSSTHLGPVLHFPGTATSHEASSNAATLPRIHSESMTPFKSINTSELNDQVSPKLQPEIPRKSIETVFDVGLQRTHRSLSTDPSYISSSYHRSERRQASAISGRKSRASSSFWGVEEQHVICAISEARGVSPSIGLAFVNISTNEAILSQICDSQFYVKSVHKIQIHDPSIVLVVNRTSFPGQRGNLLGILEEELQGIPIETLDRKYWSEAAGLDMIQKLAFKEDVEALQMAIQGNFYATSSFAAAMRYVESSCRLTVHPHSLRIRYQPSEDTMMIDVSTIQSLELIQNLENPRSSACLFGLLNHTATPMGSRMLRSNILQPSTQGEHTLGPRYDAIDELTGQEETFHEVRNALREFGDVEKLLTELVIISTETSILASEQAINRILRVKAFILAIPSLHESLALAKADLLARIRDLCRPQVVETVLDMITNTINADVTFMKTPLDLRNQRTYAVKSGVYGLLDVARQMYKEATEDVHQHLNDINTEHNLVATLKFDNSRQYWFRLRVTDLEERDIPEILINKRLIDSHKEVVMLSDKIIQQLTDAIRVHVPSLYRICEGISLLDMLASFGQSVTTRDYVRPELGETLALKCARHPVIESLPPDGFIPNDAYASDQYRFQIITGCNMSGKSTYIRMVALLQIMAQIGCFVPAEYAAFPVIDQLFVRMSTDDSIEANMSTFSLEMREMAFILRNINSRSLTIIDELGRGTSTRDGLAIALAISEALIQSNSLVWFVTHFQTLARVLGSRPGVLNLHLTTKMSTTRDDTPKMTMLYRVSSGFLLEKNYGLSLARAIGFPKRFMHTAERVSRSLEQQIEQKKQNSNSRAVIQRRNLIFNLYENLQQLQSAEVNDKELGQYLKQLQAEFVTRMDEIRW